MSYDPKNPAELVATIEAHVKRSAPEGVVFELYPDEQPLVIAALRSHPQAPASGEARILTPNIGDHEVNDLVLALRNVEHLERQVAQYRDCFAEITAKATALEFDPADPERIIAYRIACGPIHRAAGKLGHQMFDGERHLQAAIARIRELEATVLSPSQPASVELDLDLIAEAVNAGRYLRGGLPYRTLAESGSSDRDYAYRIAKSVVAALSAEGKPAA